MPTNIVWSTCNNHNVDVDNNNVDVDDDDDDGIICTCSKIKGTCDYNGSRFHVPLYKFL